MKDNKRKLVVGIMLDPVASDMETVEDEFTHWERDIIDYFDDREFLFLSLAPHELMGHQMDVLLFDYGGIMPGAQGMKDDFARSVWEYRENNPSVKVVALTNMTYEDCKDYYEQEDLDIGIVYNAGDWKKHQSSLGCLEKVFKEIDMEDDCR